MQSDAYQQYQNSTRRTSYCKFLERATQAPSNELDQGFSLSTITAGLAIAHICYESITKIVVPFLPLLSAKCATFQSPGKTSCQFVFINRMQNSEPTGSKEKMTYRNFGVSTASQQNVACREISVNNVVFVKMQHSQRYSSNESKFLFVTQFRIGIKQECIQTS
jgi:hypothetical protein